MAHYTKTKAHSTMAHHGGKVAGAGELSYATGPGKAAMSSKPNQADIGINKDSGKNCASVKTGKPYNQE